MARLMDIPAALAVLEDAVDRCRDDDVRSDEVFAALEFLAVGGIRGWPAIMFRNSLELTDPEGRWQGLNASLNAVRRAVMRK
jgi:hypothetical protein